MHNHGGILQTKGITGHGQQFTIRGRGKQLRGISPQGAGPEMLSSAMERLLRELHFTGRLSVVVQNGRVLKSGYEEGYFRQPTVY